MGFVVGRRRSLGGGPAAWLWLSLALTAVPVTPAVAASVLFRQYSPPRETLLDTATAIPAVVACCFLGCMLGEWSRRRTARAAGDDPPPGDDAR